MNGTNTNQLDFSLKRSVQILERTPKLISVWLRDIEDEWTKYSAEEGSWNVKEIIAHLILCEQTNWLVRTKIILSDGQDKTFEPIDMASHFELAGSSSLPQLVTQFGVEKRYTQGIRRIAHNGR